MERVIRTKLLTRVENAESCEISKNIFADLCLVFAWTFTYIFCENGRFPVAGHIFWHVLVFLSLKTHDFWDMISIFPPVRLLSSYTILFHFEYTPFAFIFWFISFIKTHDFLYMISIFAPVRLLSSYTILLHFGFHYWLLQTLAYLHFIIARFNSMFTYLAFQRFFYPIYLYPALLLHLYTFLCSYFKFKRSYVYYTFLCIVLALINVHKECHEYDLL